MCPGLEIVAEARNGQEAVDLTREHAPDVVFLDIRMPHGNGFDLLKKLPAAPPVVFVTAHSEYAVQAFEVQAVDYLLKPVRPARLAEAVARLQSALGQGGEEPAYGEEDRICLRTPERTLVTRADDIILLHAEGDFTRVTVEEEHPLLICQTLGIF